MVLLVPKESANNRASGTNHCVFQEFKEMCCFLGVCFKKGFFEQEDHFMFFCFLKQAFICLLEQPFQEEEPLVLLNATSRPKKDGLFKKKHSEEGLLRSLLPAVLLLPAASFYCSLKNRSSFEESLFPREQWFVSSRPKNRSLLFFFRKRTSRTTRTAFRFKQKRQTRRQVTSNITTNITINN